MAALDSRTNHGRFDLPGPDVMTMDDFVRVVSGGAAKLRHLPGLIGCTLGRALPGLTPELVDMMLADSLGDQIRAVRAFGLERRRLGDIYRPRTAIAAQSSPLSTTVASQ